ncbi:MAG: alanine racemase [Pseudomonadota bacterium]
MGRGTLTIDLDAVAANWAALDAESAPGCATAACVKADGYGLGAAAVAGRLATAGCTTFFVAMAEEGATVRAAVGDGPRIGVFSGHMPGDGSMLGDLDLTPMLNSVEQMTRHFETLPGHPFGIQLDTGMNRLGLEPADWEAVRDVALAQSPWLIMSHLACADEPDHPMNSAQLAVFTEMTGGINVPLSLAATGGILLGADYHFDLTRPGIGLYGGLPFATATPTLRLDVPVIQIRTIARGETAGYGNSWTATRETRLATIASGYADGLIRAASNRAVVFADGTPCPVVGRISMDLVTVDVTHLAQPPDTLEILGHQTPDAFATAADTIGYEVLTALGPRYLRRYSGATT